MRTPTCDLALDRAVAVGQDTRDDLHGRCPGAYRTPAGEIRACECDCHPFADLKAAATKALPVISEAPAADGPGSTAEDRKKARKRPTTGFCQHCGQPTGGRFAPGHDAKLKSELQQAAERGDPEAWAELVLRGWTHLVKIARIPVVARGTGDALVSEEGQGLMDRRNLERRERANTTGGE